MRTELSEQVDGRILLHAARVRIAETLRLEAEIVLPQPAGWLNAFGASFVTLTTQGELRGCIGTLEAYRSLIDDVQENAHAAAFRDPRFTPLRRDEFAEVRVEVSLLSSPEPMAIESEFEAMAHLRPLVDGVVLEYGCHRATFLPQVWEQLPEPRDFLRQLKRKAGLPADFWSSEVRLSRYGVQKWKEDVSR